ncbi:PTS ascorbate transporter subunit IIC [Candidatus Xianfuyuplasma coldseepsis]|uniref:Ascorbate-specific PTS system EIIC component n=1 Tax=Candidatus Xianfuyuplasma coldseepsis TaxID=2782163 RepID=A0A7L7KVH4_9MOLU|nr:PTS ascorbate transporter subunit IIC [Xianfuyuplasma coldseepsis]QMS85758.1 PTS transporter subunit IIC [Xianfuyuplasma coldseepsis]
MDWFLDFFLGFINKFLGQAPLLLGTVVFIGYMLLGKKWYTSLGGFIKTYVGFKILQVGTGGLVGTFRPIIEALTAKFGITALVIDPYYGQTSATEMLDTVSSLQYVGYVMIIAFILNIFYVGFRKYTKIRTLFITGHIMYQQSAVLLWALYWVLEGAMGVAVTWPVVIVSGLLIGTYWAVASNLIIEATNEVTDGAGFTIGHQQMFGSWIAYKIAGKIGDKEKGVDHMEFPGWLSILNDNIVANVLIMTIFVGTIMFIVGPSNFAYDDTKYFFVTYVFEKTAYFAVYIAIIQMGVRMFVSELTESFQGISNKLLPGSVPAVDCAVTFGFAPNAVMFGFIFGFFGQMLAIGLLILLNSPILIIAGFIALFFDNGTLAIFAAKAGGRRAAAIIPFFSGIIQVLGSAAVLTVLVDSPLIVGWMGMFDWATLWSGTTLLTSVAGIIVPILLIPLMLVIPQLQYRRHKDTYFTTMREEL